MGKLKDAVVEYFRPKMYRPSPEDVIDEVEGRILAFCEEKSFPYTQGIVNGERLVDMVVKMSDLKDYLK